MTRTTSGKPAAGKTATPRTSTTGAPRTRAPRTPAKGAAAKGTNVKSTATRGTAAAARGAEAESPLLPVEQLEALGRIKPGAVDWLIEQTQLEAEHRRAELARVNNLIFVEHLFAQAAALVVAACGIGGGVWLAARGQPWVGVAIAAVVMAALAVVQVSARARRP